MLTKDEKRIRDALRRLRDEDDFMLASPTVEGARKYAAKTAAACGESLKGWVIYQIDAGVSTHVEEVPAVKGVTCYDASQTLESLLDIYGITAKDARKGVKAIEKWNNRTKRWEAIS